MWIYSLSSPGGAEVPTTTTPSELSASYRPNRATVEPWKIIIFILFGGKLALREVRSVFQVHTATKHGRQTSKRGETNSKVHGLHLNTRGAPGTGDWEKSLLTGNRDAFFPSPPNSVDYFFPMCSETNIWRIMSQGSCCSSSDHHHFYILLINNSIPASTLSFPGVELPLGLW